MISPKSFNIWFKCVGENNLKLCICRWKTCRPTCGHFPWKPVSVEMRYREHGAHHWRNTLLNWGKIPRAQLRSKSLFSKNKNTKLPVRSSLLQRQDLLLAVPRRLPLFQRFWRFVLPCFCSNKGTQPMKWMNKDRKLPPQKNQVKRRLPLLQPKPRNQHGITMTTKGRASACTRKK